MKVVAYALLACVAAADCSGTDCAVPRDETSLLQVTNSVKLAGERVDQKQMPQPQMQMPPMPQMQMPMQAAGQGAAPGMPQAMPGMQYMMPPAGAPSMQMLNAMQAGNGGAPAQQQAQMMMMMPQQPQQAAPAQGGPLPTFEQFTESLAHPHESAATDPNALQVTQIALPKDLMPRGLHPGAEVPGMPAEEPQNNQLYAMNTVGGMPQQGVQPGSPLQLATAGDMQQPGMVPQLMVNQQGVPQGYLLVPSQDDESVDLESEEEEANQEVDDVVGKVMGVLSAEGGAADTVVDRVIQVLGAKKKVADQRKAAAKAADMSKRAQLHKFENKIEQKVEANVEQKVRARVEMQVREEFARKKAAKEKKKKAEIADMTLAQMASQEEAAAEKAADLNTASEQREREIAKAAAEKSAAEKVAAEAQKAVAQAASRVAAAQRAAAAAERVVAKLNHRN